MQSPPGDSPDHGAGVDGDDPVPTMSTRDIERWARRQFPQTRWTLRDVAVMSGGTLGRISGAPTVIAPVLREYARLAREYPEVAARLDVFELTELRTGAVGASSELGRSSIDPVTGARRLELNANLYSRLKRIADRLKVAERRGQFPGGTFQPESVVTHELGHHLMFWLQDAGFDPIPIIHSLAVDRRGLSLYANTLPEEAFAEAFVAHHRGDEAARNHPLTRSVVQFIDESMRALRERGGTP
jgi:hypothetical protein